MCRKSLILMLSLLLIVGLSSWGFAAKVPAPEKGGDGFTAKLQRAIAQELATYVSVDFAQTIDLDYEESLSNLIGWLEVSSPLIPDERVSWYYSQFQSLFPLTHVVFALVVSSKYKK